MRNGLDRLYDVSSWAAALMMVGTLLMVVLGMLDRYVSLSFRGTDMYAGYCMAAAGFLALAHTLKKNEHIRVTLLLNAVAPKAKKALELWSLSAAVLLSGLFCFYSIKLAYQSWDFNDISTGNDATPLWIPQIGMAAGTLVLLIAFVDELVLEFLGQRVTSSSDEALHNE
ncbi:TRAP transporter small permease [Rhodoferax sp. UBA5149]|uniref:TRAP transporter small permease n=1 Tax=Rhodoferax sp. UBA5149 TaxID=1947379 RepID=UPI0025EA6FBC|nr:TRAP transporter small permease [Rhodoferax sp. UBA5149]